MCFDLANNLPEVNAIQNGLRRVPAARLRARSRKARSLRGCLHLREIGHRHDGQRQHRAPTARSCPIPDVLLLSYTGCFTFMKWFELLREQYKCETIMLHTPYMGDGKITKNMIEYMVKQLKEEVIPEARARLRREVRHRPSARISEEINASRGRSRSRAAKRQGQALRRSTPISAASITSGRFSAPSAARDDAIDYYRFLREEVEDRLAQGQGPVTPDGDMGKEKYRLVVEGPPNYTSFRQFWKMFYDEGAVVVASSYTKVGGVYDFGFRHDPTIRWRRWPNTASVSTPTAACRCASTCWSTISRNTRRTAC
jgi:benzoyl-CoA reductase subunit B